ncbi:MAG: hypothetical protein HY466_03215 [Deltaproteobacteria bacterium]|nr:hypothetical protein [Deltaproteobacteria bacterium]
MPPVPTTDTGIPTDTYQGPDARVDQPPDGGGRLDAGVGPDAGPDAGFPPPSGRPDVNINPTSRLAVFAGAFGSPEGILASVNLDPPGAPEEHARTISTDVVLRSPAENFYVIDRTGAAIDIYNPDLPDFELLGQTDAGAWSNPQDVVVAPDGTKAYVTRLEAQNDSENDDDVFIVHPATGAFLGSIDLTSYTADDGDRLARAAQMVLVGSELFANVQDLSGSFAADTNGKVAVIDTASDEVTGVIQLPCRNPADITYSEILEKVFGTCTGVYEPDFTIDVTTPYGGVFTINPATREAELFIDDADLGGAVSEIRLASAETGYVITDFTKIASFNPETGAVIGTAVYTSPGFFLPDFTLNTEGNLIIADPAAGLIIGEEEPIVMKQPPSSLTFLPDGE